MTTATTSSSPSRRPSGATWSHRNNPARIDLMTKHLNSMAVLAFAGVVALGIASVSAHHSSTMFDHSTTMTINGGVVEWRSVNPPVSLSINGIVKERAEDGRAVWVMEMTSPGNLVRAGGWRRDAVNTGNRGGVQVTPVAAPAANAVGDVGPVGTSGGKGGANKKLTVASGGEVSAANIREQERPGLE